MKTCPICNAIAFDDAPQCFGCLHEFAGDEPVIIVPEPEQEPAPRMRPHAEAAPEFTIRFTPLIEDSGAVTWSCAVEEPAPCRAAS